MRVGRFNDSQKSELSPQRGARLIRYHRVIVRSTKKEFTSEFRAALASGTRHIPVTIRSRQTSIQMTMTHGCDSSPSEYVRMYHRSNRSSMLLSRVKLDPRLSRSVYGSRTVHGLCIAYIDHAIVHIDVNYCCFYRYSDDKQRHVIGLIYANL